MNQRRILVAYDGTEAAYWALRRLAETAGPHRPDRDRMQYLLDCVEGRRRYHDHG